MRCYDKRHDLSSRLTPKYLLLSVLRNTKNRPAYYIPSRPPFVDSAAVHQSIRESGDAYQAAQDYAYLLGRGVLPFLTWQESFAARQGANQLMTLSGQELQAISAEHQTSARPRADQIDLTSEGSPVQDRLQTRLGKIP